MAIEIIKPVLYYSGETINVDNNIVPVPITNRWIVYVYFEKDLFSKGTIRCGLAKTNNEGIMYTCLSDLNFNNDKFMATQVTDAWMMEKHYRYQYLPVSFAVNQEILLFIWPYKSISAKSVSVEYINKYDIAVRGYVKSESKAIFLNCPIEIYIERLKYYTSLLNKKIEPYQKRIDKSVICGAILDQVHNLVIGRGKSVQTSLALEAGRKGYNTTQNQILYSPNIESTVINVEIIEKMKKNLANYLKGETRSFKNRVSIEVAILNAILRSKVHNNQFLMTNWKDYGGRSKSEPPDNISSVYTAAYISLFKTDTEIARDLYSDHYKNLLSESAKGKSEAASVIEKLSKVASWVTTSMDILKIVAGARTYKIASDLKKLNTDFIGACRYLEAKGVLKDIDDLQDKLDKSFVSGIPVDANDYYEQIAPLSSDKAQEIKGLLSSGLSAIALLAALNRESKSNRDDIDKATAVYGFATSVMDIPSINKRIPKGAVISKAAGMAGAAIDWGISIYDMYEAAESGEGKKFAYSVIAYGGKGFIAGGSILLFTPFAPLGALLVGIGTAVTIIGSISEGIVDFKSIEEKQFIQLMEDKLKEHDPAIDKWFSQYYSDNLKKVKVSTTPTIAELKEQNPRYSKLVDKVTDDLTFEEYIHKFFLSSYWGFQYEILNA